MDARTTGIVLLGEQSTEFVCRPLVEELSRSFLLIDAQSGPFDLRSRIPDAEVEAAYDRQHFPVDALQDTSASCWRPGTLPAWADCSIVHEWTYFFALGESETLATQRASRIMRHRHVSDPFRDEAGDRADLFFFHADGWWEFYTSNADWHFRLRRALPGCTIRPIQQMGQSPAQDGHQHPVQGGPRSSVV